MHSILSEKGKAQSSPRPRRLSKQINVCDKNRKYFLDVQFFTDVSLIQASNQTKNNKEAFSQLWRRQSTNLHGKTNQLEQ